MEDTFVFPCKELKAAISESLFWYRIRAGKRFN